MEQLSSGAHGSDRKVHHFLTLFDFLTAVLVLYLPGQSKSLCSFATSYCSVAVSYCSFAATADRNAISPA